MKKTWNYLTCMSVVLILVLVFSTTAFAHHGGGQVKAEKDFMVFR